MSADPRRTRRLGRALFGYALVTALYAAASAAHAVNGAVPAAPILIGLDPVNYYFWQMLFVWPWAAAVWALSSLVLAVSAAGEGRVSLFAAVARALSLPLLITWVPAAAEALLMGLGMGQREWVDLLSEPGLWQAVYLGLYVLAGILTWVRLAVAARRVGKMGPARALVAGTLAGLLVVAAFVAFIR